MLNYIVPVYVATVGNKDYYIRKRLTHKGYEVSYTDAHTGEDMFDVDVTHVEYCLTTTEAEDIINNININKTQESIW